MKIIGFSYKINLVRIEFSSCKTPTDLISMLMGFLRQNYPLLLLGTLIAKRVRKGLTIIFQVTFLANFRTLFTSNS